MEGERSLPLVLVPGACLGGWCWRDAASHLRGLGHEVFPVTLTGLGERVHLSSSEIDLDTHITDVVNLLDYEDLRDAVLVGHSYAGAVITGVADRRAERLSALVYLDASPLPDGAAVVDLQSEEQRQRQLHEVREAGEGWRWPAPDRQTLQSGLYGSVSGLSERDFDLIERLATAQPYATFTSRLRLRAGAAPGPRRVVILCAAGGMSVALLRELVAKGDPRAAVFAKGDWQLEEIATGHWSMLSAPDALAKVLHRTAAASAIDQSAQKH
jgi:pimeloyl-ACP methyl ester carboxylesterase